MDIKELKRWLGWLFVGPPKYFYQVYSSIDDVVQRSSSTIVVAYEEGDSKLDLFSSIDISDPCSTKWPLIQEKDVRRTFSTHSMKSGPFPSTPLFPIATSRESDLCTISLLRQVMRTWNGWWSVLVLSLVLHEVPLPWFRSGLIKLRW